ncbi:MAG: LamG-like jellyroll fold domain-containing protein [Polyangiaceae bacterium]
MSPRRVAVRSARCSTALLCLSVLGCSGETRVSLLDPIVSNRPDAAVPHGGAGGAPEGGASSTPEAGANGTPDVTPDAGSTGDSHLIHRYSFSGTDLQVIDSMGGPHGTLVNGAYFDGAGHAVLDGRDDFVDLPDGLISGLKAATLVSWLSWNGGPCWQRVFDFGSNDGDAGDVGNATSSVFATTLRCPEDGPDAGPGAVFELNEILGSVDGTTKFPVLVETSIAVAFDPANQEMRLYVAGKRIGAGKFTTLSAISDVNAWLGRSQWVQDIYLRGSLDEFRIYDVALDDAALAAIDAAGPDAP